MDQLDETLAVAADADAEGRHEEARTLRGGVVTLQISTSRVSYGGLDRLDITSKSKGPGRIYAPSAEILMPALIKRRQAKELAAAGMPAKAALLEGQAWREYAPRYREEMLVCYRQHRRKWHDLLRAQHVVFVCYCVNHLHCHRTLLAGFFEKLGATLHGEIKI